MSLNRHREEVSASSIRGILGPVEEIIIESCHSTWIIDMENSRFRRVVKGSNNHAAPASTEWQACYGVEIDPLSESFVVLLNPEGTRLLRSWRHVEHCSQCGGEATSELSLRDLRSAVRGLIGPSRLIRAFEVDRGYAALIHPESPDKGRYRRGGIVHELHPRVQESDRSGRLPGIDLSTMTNSWQVRGRFTTDRIQREVARNSREVPRKRHEHEPSLNPNEAADRRMVAIIRTLVRS